MVVCPFFLQGTCKFGQRCYNDHIQNPSFPIFRQNRGGGGGLKIRGRGRGRGGGSSGPIGSSGQYQETAVEYYSRMDREMQQERQNNPGGRVTVASRYNLPINSQGKLNRTNESKSSGKSNGYLKRNGFGSASATTNGDDEDELYNGHIPFATQESETSSMSSGSSRNSDEPDYTRQRRRRPHRFNSTTKVKSSSPKPRSNSTNSTQKEGSDKVEWQSSDPDQMFLRSILPTLQALDEYQKSTAKLQIQELLHKARFLTLDEKK